MLREQWAEGKHTLREQWVEETNVCKEHRGDSSLYTINKRKKVRKKVRTYLHKVI